MAIQYKLYKAKRNDKFNGKIYARATYNEMFDLKMLAQHMAVGAPRIRTRHRNEATCRDKGAAARLPAVS